MDVKFLQGNLALAPSLGMPIPPSFSDINHYYPIIYNSTMTGLINNFTFINLLLVIKSATTIHTFFFKFC